MLSGNRCLVRIMGRVDCFLLRHVLEQGEIQIGVIWEKPVLHLVGTGRVTHYQD